MTTALLQPEMHHPQSELQFIHSLLVNLKTTYMYVRPGISTCVEIMKMMSLCL